MSDKVMSDKVSNILLCKNDRTMHLYKLFIGNTIGDITEVQPILNQLTETSQNDYLEIRISSFGGYVHTGQAIINAMNDYFFERNTTVIDSIAFSMAALIFLSGAERIVYPHSTLMLHDFSSGYNDKMGAIESRVKFERKHLRKFLRSIVQDFMTKDEISEILSGKDVYLNTKDMCNREMAQKVIMPGNKILNGKDYLIKLKEDK